MIAPLRLNATSRAAARTDAARPRNASGTSFTGQVASRQAAPAGGGTPLRPVASLDALVALQSVDGVSSRRRRATRRGSALLDDLEALKLAVLEGRAAEPELERIGRLVTSAREASGDEGLDALLDDIELRAKVELAKRRR